MTYPTYSDRRNEIVAPWKGLAAVVRLVRGWRPWSPSSTVPAGLRMVLLHVNTIPTVDLPLTFFGRRPTAVEKLGSR